MKKTILILGDSWTQGELDIPDAGPGRKILHKGLEQYLLDNEYNVVNLGGLGETNYHACRQLQNYKGPADYVFWITTDPFRDINSELLINADAFINLVAESKSIRAAFEKKLLSSYEKMNTIAQTKNLVVHVMGGLTKIHGNISQYSNLVPYIDSIKEFLVPGSIVNPHFIALTFDFSKNIIEDIKDLHVLTDNELINLKAEYVYLSDQLKAAEELRRLNPEVFYPDGDHPNRHGHWLLFNKIKEYIENGK